MTRHQFNTVASAGMKILNALESLNRSGADAGLRRGVLTEGLSILLRLLSPITPHIAHRLWRELGLGADILSAPWPEPDESALIADEIDLVVQINGKKRGTIRVPANATPAEIEKLALADPNIQKWVAGQTMKKVIVVPDRLVNVVV
jgi:leucyl-tRNA synthetase